MVAVKFQNFGGMIPAVDDTLLPTNSAVILENGSVKNGTLEGFKGLRKVYEPTNPNTQKVFRIPLGQTDAQRIPDSFWMEFLSPNTDVVWGVTAGDQFDRYYWASDVHRPLYNTRARILNGDAPYFLGVPRSSAAPSVVVTGGSGHTETRAYVYTWVTAFGEEGAPSLPALVTGNSNGTWTVTVTAPSSGQLANRNLDAVRIYRTVSGVGGSTDYFFVGEMDIETTEFVDNIATVTGNRLLQSLFWTEPPEDLEGIISMPNGIIAGWRDNEIWFSEPYRPHAWPVNYQISVDSGIVGLGVIGQTLIVCTEGAPHAVSGVNPGSMAQAKLATFEPCESRGSIVSTPQGVIYASPNGLVLATPASAVVMTQQMIPKENWGELLYLRTVFAATFDGGYYALGSSAIGCFDPGGFDPDRFLQLDLTGAYTGVFVDPFDNRVAVSKLRQTEPVRSVFLDSWTNEVFIVREDGVFWLDQRRACTIPREPYIWRSKVLETPAAGNFGAMRVYFETHACSPDLNPVQDVSQDQTLKDDQWGLIRVYGDGVLRFTRELRRSGEFFRLPAGFKATYWNVEVESRVRVKSIEVAGAARELGNV